MRLFAIVFLIVLASVGMSITGAAPVLPKQKETIIEDESKLKKKGDRDTEISLSDESDLMH